LGILTQSAKGEKKGPQGKEALLGNMGGQAHHIKSTRKGKEEGADEGGKGRVLFFGRKKRGGRRIELRGTSCLFLRRGLFNVAEGGQNFFYERIGGDCDAPSASLHYPVWKGPKKVPSRATQFARGGGILQKDLLGDADKKGRSCRHRKGC